MSWYEILMGAILIVTSLILIIVVLMQEGRADGLSGAIAGGAETFFGKNKGRTVEQKLVKVTKALAVIFFVLSLAATLVVLFVK